MDSDPMVARLMDIAKALEGLNRHASVHAGGVVISDSRPLTEHVPVYVDKKGMLISQYDMKRIEQVGLIKLDMLGLEDPDRYPEDPGDPKGPGHRARHHKDPAG